MAAIDGISLDQLDAAIRQHSSSAKRFYSDLEGKQLGGGVHNMKLMDPRDLTGESVFIYGHAPASRAARMAALKGDIPSPVNVFSVTDKDRKIIGQVTNIGIKDVGGAIDRGQLATHLDAPEGAKTRNTFVTGTVTGPAGRRPSKAEPLGVKQGRLFIPGQDEDLWQGSLEKGAPTTSGIIGRRAAFSTGSSYDRPSAWIIR